MSRFQSFGGKLLLLCVLIAAAQFVTYFIVLRAQRAAARAQIELDLSTAAGTFQRVVAERNAILATGAHSVAGDYAFKRLFGETPDRPTLASALESLRLRIDADTVTVLSLSAETLASTDANEAAAPAVFSELLTRADADPSPNPSATGYGFVGPKLYSFVTVPVRTPDIVAWLVIGFSIDDAFLKRLKLLTPVEITFSNPSTQFAASTLEPENFRALLAALPSAASRAGVFLLNLSDGAYLTTVSELPTSDHLSAILSLQYSLDEKLAPARKLEGTILWVALTSVALAGLASLAFARRLSRPVQQLAAHTQVIARGDYATPITLNRNDELGHLANAFNRMSLGLAERDRVRDLLDKNVSPEVAAQLMRDGAALGGEEREVTILFADLRGFTTLSEKLPPREVVTLLNRYLDRMSAALEAHGGIIDKYIGDEIMALFGAPVAQNDAADRALAAALAMERALAVLNTELAAEGRPPLALGIGINTAHIVAGNIGSHRRLNYSVIGDGVNIAARLQSLTRTPAFKTNIIISAATVAALRDSKSTPRPLGPAPLKGRTEPVEIFAVEA